jgi:hypothetical protein
MVMGLKAILAGAVLFLAGSIYAGDGTTKPAVQFRLDGETGTSASETVEAGYETVELSGAETVCCCAYDDCQIDYVSLTGTKPATRGRIVMETEARCGCHHGEVSMNE